MNRLSVRIFVVLLINILTSSILLAEKPASMRDNRVEIVVDLDNEIGEMYNFWNVYPVTDQAPFLDEQQYDQLGNTYHYAEFINCVRLLGGIDLEKDDYFRGVDGQGEAECDFSEAVAMLSGIRDCGFTPWIVLDNVPADMSKNPTQNRYGNTEPPADFDLWSSYVRQFVETLVGEFGREEVVQWRFRVGTEPDLNPGHWSGTKEQYLKHYDYTVAAVLSVLPNADIGPGNIMDPVKQRKWKTWGIEIIDHCATGTNHVTGEMGTPLRFFGSSYYTDVGTSDERFDDLVRLLRDKLGEYPQFADVPVEIQEFGILSEDGKWIVGDGTEFGGSWLPHFADKIYRNDVRRVFQWWWNTNKGGSLPIPLTHAMDKLEEMAGGTRLSVETSLKSENDHIGCIAATNEDRLDLIVFRHLSVRENGEKIPVRVTLSDESLAINKWTVTRANLIDGEHAGFMGHRNADMKQARARADDEANPYAIAVEVMAAHQSEYEEMSVLHSLAPFPEPTIDSSGQMRFDLMMDGHSVILLRLEKAE
jgi:xylan 1,4-beta-xylosidase